MALPCPRCRSAIPAGARFCPQCGAGVPDRAAAPRTRGGGGIDVCAGCGVIAPAQGVACSVCTASLAETRMWVEPRTDDFYWVAVRCRFQCRSCGHLSPLDHLDTDGTVVCLRCGLSQVFDVDQWEDGLAHAHAVGDLSGPNAEGRHPNPRRPITDRNPFKKIGLTMTSAELAQSGISLSDGMMHTHSLRVDASPGHPLCDRCRRPLTVQLVSDTHCTARCVPCGTEVGYDVPQRAVDINGSLKAAIAEELSVGRTPARFDQANEGGAIGLRCPHCDAAMTITGTSQIVTCEFCHASSRIPSAALHSLGFADPQPLVWWLLFGGRSEQRLQLESEHEERDPTPPIALPKFERDQSGPTPRVRAVREGPSRLLAIWIPVLITAAVGYIGFGDEIAAWRGAATTAVGKDAADYVALRGCQCADNDAQLELHVDEIGTRDKAIMDLRFRLAESGRTVELAATKRTAPPSRWRQRDIGIGVACTRDALVVAIDRRVTAWRRSDGTAMWTTKLRRRYRYDGTAPPSGLSAYCGQLHIDDGAVRVPMIGHDREALVDLDDGKIRKR